MLSHIPILQLSGGHTPLRGTRCVAMDTKCLAAHGHRPTHPKLMLSSGPLHPVLVTSPSQTVETNKKQRKQQFPKKRNCWNHLGVWVGKQMKSPILTNPPPTKTCQCREGLTQDILSFPPAPDDPAPTIRGGVVPGVQSFGGRFREFSQILQSWKSCFRNQKKVTHVTHDKLEVGNQLLKWRLVGLDMFFLQFVIATSLSFATFHLNLLYHLIHLFYLQSKTDKLTSLRVKSKTFKNPFI